jgi:2-alkyl-3-oxoalkanoate reductase
MDNINRSPILITGISGFIGSHFAERCAKEGLQVKGLCRRPQDVEWLENERIEIIKGDLVNQNDIENALSSCKVVVHTAGWSGSIDVPSELAWYTNVTSTKLLIDASLKSGVKLFVFISSVAVYGINNEPILYESMPTPQIGELYPDSKIEAERIVKNSGIPFIIIRPGSIYGPRGKGWTIDVINKMKKGQFVFGNSGGKITPGFIDNFIDGLWLCLFSEMAIGKIFNLCDDEAMTYDAYYSEYAKMLGMESIPVLSKWKVIIAKSIFASIIRKMLGRSSVGKWSNHFRFNPSKFSIKNANEVLGYTPKVTFEEGILITKKWLFDNKYLNK